MRGSGRRAGDGDVMEEVVVAFGIGTGAVVALGREKDCSDVGVESSIAVEDAVERCGCAGKG